MKANELIHKGLYKVGDEVVIFFALNGKLYKPEDGLGRFFGKIYEDSETGKLEAQLENGVWEEVMPILLTEDILKANGFEDETSDFWKLRVDDKPHHYAFRLNKGGVFCSDGYSMNCNIYTITIKFVHELQRAFCLCGLTELADNFRVE